jgi:hypothetical protein
VKAATSTDFLLSHPTPLTHRLPTRPQGGAYFGGAIDGSGTIRRRFFFSNSAIKGGSAINIFGNLPIEDCTIGVNEGSHPIRIETGPFSISNSIIAFNDWGPGPAIEGSVASIACTDIFENKGGDWVGEIADDLGKNGNIFADPLFCDPDNGDYTL